MPPVLVRVVREAEVSYRIPSLAEIQALRGRSGRTLVSTFSGCGGACLGYEWAGFSPLYALEFVEAARDVYRANHPGVYVEGRDIREVSADEILERTGMKRGELDLLEGSPPCASFSVSGKREKGWGRVKSYSDTKQRTDDLFFEFVRLVRGLQPKVFAAENVPGLMVGVAKGYFKQILAALKAEGYRVTAVKLDGQWLGVPQARRRLFFVGVRDDLPGEFSPPAPFDYQVSIWEAFGGASRLEPVEPESSIVGYCTHGEWRRLRPGEASKRYFNLVRPRLDCPSPTILASHGSRGIASVTHPLEPRKFSIAELRRLCGFPDDFVLLGTYAQQWERLGRSVPPPMTRALGSSLLEVLNVPDAT